MVGCGYGCGYTRRMPLKRDYLYHPNQRLRASRKVSFQKLLRNNAKSPTFSASRRWTWWATATSSKTEGTHEHKPAATSRSGESVLINIAQNILQILGENSRALRHRGTHLPGVRVQAMERSRNKARLGPHKGSWNSATSVRQRSFKNFY